ncbi:MAG: bifunctional folylpolyglutamate synthase/dihydrofolate synthase [Porticoccaceae bacterium]|mgnify:CR=1 FL=1|jgi:dihydrofolate synthase/folylpolyglutamate synthase|nr:bifunctional folylpolyglutamate synthase/dihydrofolate synthase [Porticoccaceae bacterium]MBT3797621.1 bifunctional folylpolyglutamate synthase/dihydrofolate synthase [Porticoccaceae bacterium]MBT4163202.1 bifunctional folylpolyglutamate synthase/dihydrofolate synthase [Porticoccaceae bacterium]MBT4212343.1 bifunctional folylpolyglutamate synthase/dihydrofolate synthase [Porticoccaceae bacterium]MBT4591746.1 bifunctional folylpolyglutamate synthase/dihydrofolate synthase [Porticoccaceae bact|tara:strand:- start:1234 stop:2517 length:1284 start_codon:yes stop_codon:yes gene_type:complete
MPNRSLSEWLTILEARHPSEIDLGLDRVSEVWCRLNAKRETISSKVAPIIVTVAGTNGKGSCIAAMQAILLAHDYSVGDFTSPHFLEYNERISIAGVSVSDESIVDAFAAIESVRGEVSLTYFEFNTLAALVIFDQYELDIVLLEVGLGGRLDAINIIDPDVAVVTSIDLDHQDWLGDTRVEIAAEKLGISRAKKPLIIGEQNPPDGFDELVLKTGAAAVMIGRDFSIINTTTGSHFTAMVQGSGGLSSFPDIEVSGLLPQNKILAIQSLISAGLELNPEKVAESLKSVLLVGRQQSLIFNGVNVLLDVAHNPAAAAILKQNIPIIKGKTYAVASVLADKDWAGIISQIGDRLDVILVAKISDNPRASSAQSMLDMVYTAGLKGYHCDSIEDAFLKAVAEASAGDQIVVFGSFHTVSSVLKIISKEA